MGDKQSLITLPSGVPLMVPRGTTVVPEGSKFFISSEGGRRFPLIVPSEVRVTKATVKSFIFDDTLDHEGFSFVVEEASVFFRYRSLETKAVEGVIKNRGKGFPGGGVEDDETAYLDVLRARHIPIDEVLEKALSSVVIPKEYQHFLPIMRDVFIAAIRENEEETGIDAGVLVEVLREMADSGKLTIWVRISGVERHPWILIPFCRRGLEVHRDRIQDEKLTDSIYKFQKVGWARFSNLRKTILSSRDPKEEEERKKAGDAAFYTGHLVGIFAMLILFGRRDLFYAALKNLSFEQIFSIPMLEMLASLGQESVYRYYLSLPRFVPRPNIGKVIVRHLVAVGKEADVSLLLDRNIPQKDELAAWLQTQLAVKKLMPDMHRDMVIDERVRDETAEAVERAPEELVQENAAVEDDFTLWEKAIAGVQKEF